MIYTNISKKYKINALPSEKINNNFIVSDLLAEILDGSFFAAGSWVKFLDEKFDKNNADKKMAILYDEYIILFIHICSRIAFDQLGDLNSGLISLMEKDLFDNILLFLGKDRRFKNEFNQRMLLYASSKDIFFKDKILSADGVINKFTWKITNELFESNHNPEIFRQIVANISTLLETMDLKLKVEKTINGYKKSKQGRSRNVMFIDYLL